jgi:L-ascorbate metabolism protein UlaG (beta-lactamase superfamily)
MLDTRGNKITYFGHATFSLTTPSGQVALIDPFVMHNPLCPEKLKKFSRLDVIFLSHAHGDHFADLVELAKLHMSKVFAIFETAMWLHGKGIDKAHPMGKGGSQKFGDFEVTLTHAFHSNSIEEGGNIIYAGEPAGLIIRMPGGFTIYHAGDTCVFGDMKLIGEIYKPSVAMLPVGDNFTMGPREAAYAVRLLGIKEVIPMHYGTFPPLVGTPEEFKAQTKDITGLNIHVMKPGDTIG